MLRWFVFGISIVVFCEFTVSVRTDMSSLIPDKSGVVFLDLFFHILIVFVDLKSSVENTDGDPSAIAANIFPPLKVIPPTSISAISIDS